MLVGLEQIGKQIGPRTLFAGVTLQIRAGDRTEFRANENSGALLSPILLVAFGVTTFGAATVAGPRRKRCEDNLVYLVGLLHPSRL